MPVPKKSVRAGRDLYTGQSKTLTKKKILQEQQKQRFTPLLRQGK